MKTTICFGEPLIRYQSYGDAFFDNHHLVKAYPGGSEANVAVKLAQLGIAAQFVSAGPDNEIMREYLSVLNNQYVDTNNFHFSGERLGSYILQSPNGLTKGEVIYDRKYSSFSNLKAGEINWDKVLANCNWLHWTALTPALNEDLVEVLKEFLQEASKRNITISVDLNYRQKLWQYGKSPNEVMPELAQYCDVIMGNIWASNKMLGTEVPENLDDQTSPDEYLSISQKVSEELFAMYPKAKLVANTFRFMNNNKHNCLYGTAHTRKEHVLSPVMETNVLVDRIGSGDAFMAGIIAGIQQNDSLQDTINLAVKCGYEKLFVEGDFEIK